MTCLAAAVALPLISFFLSFAIAEKYSWIVSFSAPFLLLLSTGAAGFVFYAVWNNEPVHLQWHWFTSAGYTFTAGVLLNNIAALMLLLVTFISFIVHSYSTAYMAGDPDFRQYFAMLGFFTFSMLGIVVVDNLLLIFIFWELVGFSSYMLIGHWREKPEAAEAAKRAFLINRAGDIGFLIGLMILWTNTGSFNLMDIDLLSGNSSWMTTASICVFCGVIGKSAQFPLFSWLPDAMEGPTPVSALIHAATMVAAGIFLLARVYSLFTPAALDVVVIIGTLTAIAGALSALVQFDLKKILAYSTISQLGLMVVAIGAGAPEAAMLHLFTHAFFKACLFLGAGSVIHSLHQAQHQSNTALDVQDIRNLGGLQKKLPFTFVIFLLSGAALAGVPLSTGFLSKDAILNSLMAWKGSDVSWRWLIFAAAFLVSFITVLYTFRLIWSVFKGEQTVTAPLSIEEPPVAMRVPMAILAVTSCWLFISWNPFDFSGWIYNGLTSGKHFHFTIIATVSAGWIVVALVVAYVMRERSFKSTVLLNGFYLDRVYRWLIESPAFQLALFTNRVDKKWLDGVLHTSAYLQLIAAHFTGWFDRVFVDGIVDSAAGLTKGIGSFARSFQSGKIQLYIFWAVFTIIIFIIWTLL